MAESQPGKNDDISRGQQEKDAIRIKAQYVVGGSSEWKTMAIDPKITSYEGMILLLRKAFDLMGEFSISYLLPKSPSSKDRKDLFLSLLSDWDLDAAFHTAASPYLIIKIEEPSDTNWAIVEECEAPSIQDIRSNVPTLPFKAIFRNEITRTFNRFLDTLLQFRKQPMLTESEFVNFFDANGRVNNGLDLRARIFSGGLEDRLRKEVWTHILGVYPPDLTSQERGRFILMRNQVYHHLKCDWLERKPEEIHDIVHMIQKDVLRTDKHLGFFSVPEDHPNVVSLFNILATYSLNNPDVSYCQGMSDLASPLLVVLEDETMAYWCFCALMRRMKHNFLRQGWPMNDNFNYLSVFLKRVDMDLYSHLQDIAADNLFFCYRMLLLDLKREFPFQGALAVMECIWSSIPPDLNDREEITRFYNKIYQMNMPSGGVSGGGGVSGANAPLQWEGLYSKRDAPNESMSPIPHPWLINSGCPMTLLLCLSLLLLHREQILKKVDYNDLGMYFDKLIRQHDAAKTLLKAKGLFVEYIKAFLDGQTIDLGKSLHSSCNGTQSDGVQC
eukprot:gene5920-6606_t